MFSGIVGFGQYCAANTDPEGAMKIVKMLNELYTVFDALTDSKRNLNVYKVSANTHPIYIYIEHLCKSVFSVYKLYSINFQLTCVTARLSN